jgi:S-adenosylmethionine synthetase
MANLKDKLFWEKFRPNSLEAGQGKIPIILLPRIANIVNKGVLLNIFKFKILQL